MEGRLQQKKLPHRTASNLGEDRQEMIGGKQYRNINIEIYK